MFITDPTRRFEVKPANSSSGNVCPMLTAYINSAAGTNVVVISAVAGQRIRVMGVEAQCGAVAGNVQLKNGSAGSVMFGPFDPPIIGDRRTYFRPVIDSGYFECSTNTQLVADLAQPTVLNVFYIIYTA